MKPDFVDKTSSHKSRYRLVSGIAFLALAAFFWSKSGPNFSSGPPPTSFGVHDNVDSVGQCAASTVPPASPPAPVNPWSSLTVTELVQIQDWLFAPKQGLNLTRGTIAVPSDNHLYIIEAYYPPKPAVLDYLSSPSTANLPSRFVRVTIHHGAAEVPIVRNYLVGPLPIGPHTSLSPLTDIYHVDPIPYNSRSFDTRDWEAPEIYSNIAAPVAEALEVSRICHVTLLVSHRCQGIV